ncbi:MAG: YdeI/OmpD-associated family protein [Bacteroidetes bacterium]|nr:YdeI/OmpD-associated family protein [Bacteroidota bacterium]
MTKKDKRIDAYISRSAEFAQPILKHFRELVHQACPEAEETMKWSFPHFDYKGSMMCSMAAFKQHCAIGFWKASLLSDSKRLVEKAKSEEAMGHLGRITSLKDLPKDAVILKYIKEAKQLNDEGIKLPAKTKALVTKVVKAPDYFLTALTKNKKALKTFEGFSASQKKEYIVWVTEAKTETTRASRLETAVEWMSEGKIRNWKYLKK